MKTIENFIVCAMNHLITSLQSIFFEFLHKLNLLVIILILFKSCKTPIKKKFIE